MILYCAADLLWASKIKGTADALGLPCRPARNPDMLAARLGDSPVRSLIVDLEAEHAFALIAAARAADTSRTTPVRILAFGSHVMVDALRTAKAQGADTVMARGAFASRLPSVLQDLSAAASVLADDLHE